MNTQKKVIDSRIGKLELQNGLATEKTLATLYDEIDFQRACQAYLWALPIVNIGEWQRAHKEDFGAGDGDIVIYTTYEHKLGILTPNITTPYIISFANLSETGPLVIDYPKGASAGGVLDFWQRPLFDMGETGPDKGTGAKYIVVGPGQEVPAAEKGCHVYLSPTFNIGIGYRVLEANPDDAEALMYAVKIYPFSQRDNPTETKFLKPEDNGCKYWSQTPPSGLAYWERLAELLNREEVADRDRFFMAMLKPLGIEKRDDKMPPFHPDERQKKLLEEAAVVGQEMAKANSFDKRFPDSLYRDGARWESLFAPGFTPAQDVRNYSQLDERAAYTWEAVWTTAGMVTTTAEVGQVYLGVHRDKNGDAFDGARSYRLKVSAEPPAKNFWSITIYDLETRRPVENAERIVDRSSRKGENSLVINDDGSTDIYFGPEAEPGHERNSLTTVPGRAWFALLRLYAPEQAYFDRSWPLPDIELVVNNITPAEARAIAKEAYIYGFPIVDNYRIMYSYFVDHGDPDFKAPWNQLCNIPAVYTYKDTAVQTPNSDTPYSWIGLDLRTEPIVFTVPKIEEDRYFSIQLIDLYTYNFDYIGTRATTNDGGSFLIAGPTWLESRGVIPKGITKVIRAETEIALALFRTQLFDPKDLHNVIKIQNQYLVQPLSTFLGQPAPDPALPIDFITPLSSEQQKTSLEFFDILNFALQFAPTHPSEIDIMARFAKIDVGLGKHFGSRNLSLSQTSAVKQGMAEAWNAYAGLEGQITKGEVTSGDVFGTREYLANNYLYRMTADVLGIYGNSKEEAMYPTYYVDGNGQKLDGAHQYIIRFAKDQLPPAHAFWSLTMYKQPESLLVKNPIERYLLNSTMVNDFHYDADGGLTFLIQYESPGEDKQANWLPAPEGPFSVIMRLYWPAEEALNGDWTPPPMQLVN